MRRIGRTDAQRRWDVLPQEPAVAYDLAHNRLVISAAALQAPVLDMEQDMAAQYGSLGALVGHELSRAVDLKGQLVDASGNLRSWWTPQDEAAFASRANQLATQYASYPYPATSGLRVDAALTREQNVADLAAVELAFDALATAQPTLDNAARESFFRAWAGLWREQLAADTATQDASTLPHAPGQWRANGPLVNHPAFVETFKCKAGNAMTRKPEEQVSIWR
jgi:putative endopeptidase